LRSLLKWLGIYFLFLTGALWLAKWRLRRRGAIVVLTFHRVARSADFAISSLIPGMTVREETFSRLLDYVDRSMIAVGLAGDRPDWGPSAKPRICLTFDDGWQDNLEVAVPLARRHGIPLTIFVCPALFGAPMPFWPAQDDLTLSLDGVRSLQSAGVTLGSHTLHHQILLHVPAAEALKEIRESRRLMEELLGAPCRLFSYPNGDWSGPVRRLVANSGYDLAFLNSPGIWTAETDPLLIPRVNVWESSMVDPWGRFSPALFEYVVFWRAWRAPTPVPSGHWSGPGIR
jgi:peptidoglycan/xylan/chitin deacetylase (PgdA/CDA1 family)